MRRLYCVLTFLTIAAYLYAWRTDWFTDAALSPVARNPLFSDPLELRKPGTFVWIVPNEQWVFKQGKARLSLVLNLHLMGDVASSRGAVQLNVKIVATGKARDGTKENRLVKNLYFQTDEPFSSAGNSLWESRGRGRIEYGLGLVDIHADEELTIEFVITMPDSELARGMPRLKLVGDHDYAAVGLENLFFAWLPDIGLVICLVLLAGLALMAWQRNDYEKVHKRSPIADPAPPT